MRGQVLLAEVTRNGWVESVHAGHAVIVDPHGDVIRAWGRPQDPMLPRSSSKPLQAAGMVGAGLELAPEQLAVASASHNGEAIHVEVVRGILSQGGLAESDLDNTPALPSDPDARAEWIRAGGGPSSVTQNCSGKHAAMLRTAVAMGAPIHAYLEPSHPVQRAVAAGIERLSGERIAAIGVDGCGAPVAAISLVGLARAFSQMVQASSGTPERRVADAMSTFPTLVGGTGRDVTDFMACLPGAIAKDGAEAVHAFALPDGRAGALKVADGSERARAAVLLALLRHVGVGENVLSAVRPAPVLGGGRAVGAVSALI